MSRIGVLPLLAAALLAGAGESGAGGRPPTPVYVEPVVERAVAPSIAAIGSLAARARVRIAAREEGLVDEVLVDEAAAVASGEVLVRLDARRIDAAIAEREGDLATARAEIVRAEAERERAAIDAEAAAEGVANEYQSELDAARAAASEQVAAAALSAAEARTAAIEGALSLLRIRREDTTVAAPVDGRVIERHVEPGDWVRPGDVLLTVAVLDPLEVEVDLPERVWPGVRAHADVLDVTVRTDGSRHRGERVRVVPEVDGRTRTFRVLADIPDPAGNLAPGLTVRVAVPTEERRRRMLVAKAAVIETAGGAVVWKLGDGEGGGTVGIQVPVEVLFPVGGRVAVVADGLAVGDQVIVEGNERLRPGTPVRPVESGER